MAWTTGNQDVFPSNNVNRELLELKGELSDEEARISLAKFLRANLRLTCKLVLGIDLEIFQEVILYGMFNRNFSLLVMTRGGGKSFIVAVYAILKMIFSPTSKILIASSTFRASRRIFNEIERILNRPEAALAAQCFRQNPGRTLKRSDEWIMFMEGAEGTITAIPLSGEKIRGFRSDCLLLEEMATLDEQTIKTILMPFLNVPLDVSQRIQIRRKENDLIKAGKLTEEERVVFPNTSQMIGLSSASYTFEFFYQTYKLYYDIIDNPDILKQEEFAADEDKKAMKDSSYFIAQMSYRALPEHMVDQAAVQIAKSQDGVNSFKREYEAQFIDGGDGYFSPKKMAECTVPDGHPEIVELIGDPEAEYILAVDPNFSNAKNADYFAMALLRLTKDKNGRDIAYYVHGYQKAGGSVRGHLNYLYYLFTNFNIVLSIWDSGGSDQLHGALESSVLFKSYAKKLNFFNFDSSKEGSEWIEMLDQAKREYNFDSGNIIMKQYFTSNWILRANEYLVSCIEHKRLWFGGKSAAHPDIFEKMLDTKLPLDLMFTAEDIDKADDDEEENATLKMGIRDAFELQDFIIHDTKAQCALITPQGGGITGIPRFDLPANLRRQSSATKARRDNYTALLLANWGAKIYQDLKDPNKTRLNRYQDIGFCAPIVTSQY